MKGVQVEEQEQARRLLCRARELTGPVLRRAVDQLAEPVRTVARYHFGWCDVRGVPTDDSWGKGIRGALVLAGAETVGGPSDKTLLCAAAVELVHNFTVLHDDVMDADTLRRGRPTAWRAFGEAQAVLAGDALLALAVHLLTTIPAPTELAELSGALLELVAGQGADLAFEQRDDFGVHESLVMAAGKTASLMGTACALGALSVDGSPREVNSLRDFGHHLGMAFQLADDLVGIWGDPEQTGKPVGSDLRRRKKSLPVVAALSAGGQASRTLAQLYLGRGLLEGSEVTLATTLIEEAGGRTWAQQEVARERCLALGHLAAFPDSMATSALRSLTHVVTDGEPQDPDQV